ncbi:myo-inositol catabolism protein IolC [Kitasatospora sp. MAA19]|nr:myo-inositol catabolism protein IolC [Kitasatospora sp. MAA19]
MEHLVPTAPETARNGQADLIEAITEAVRDGDNRTVRRLLARFAELATITDLYALRDALDTARPPGAHG